MELSGCTVYLTKWESYLITIPKGCTTTGCAIFVSLLAGPHPTPVVPSPHREARVCRSAPTASHHGQRAPPTGRLAGPPWTQGALCPTIPENHGVDERRRRGACSGSLPGTKLVLCHDLCVLCSPLAMPRSRVPHGGGVLCHRSRAA